jgi:hypothetical protein
MKSIIALLIILLSVTSCGTIQNLSKKEGKSKSDSTYSKSLDSSFVSSTVDLKDSTGISNWQKETIIEYYEDFSFSPDTLNAIVMRKDTLIIPKVNKLKSITVREKIKESTKLTISSKNDGDINVLKSENGETQKNVQVLEQTKVVTNKPIWPYILGLIAVLLFGAFFYFGKINPFSFIKSFFS